MRYLLPIVLICLSIASTKAQEVRPEQQSLITKIAATWCVNCGTWGWDVYDEIIEDNKEDAVIITAHYNGDLFTTTARAMSNNFGSVGQPQYFLNSEHTRLHEGNAQQKRVDIQTTVATNAEQLPIANTGVLYELEDSTLKAKVKVEFFQEGQGEFYIAAYVLENGVLAYQEGKYEVVAHKKVLRAALTDNPFGEAFGGLTIANGSEFIRDFSINIPAEWNLDNLELATIIYKKVGDKYQYVNGTSLPIEGATNAEANTENTSYFSKFPWLETIIAENNCCDNHTITVYNSGIYQFIFIATKKDCSDQQGKLYFQDGTFYCAESASMNCRQAYGLSEENIAFSWTCTGEVDMSTEEEETEDTTINSFENFAWLTELIDTENCCTNAKVTAYASGVFTFLYIEPMADCSTSFGQLYFQDGTSYCGDATSLDCRQAYGLLEENAVVLWSCGEDLSNELPSNALLKSKTATPITNFSLFPNPAVNQVQLQLSRFIEQNWQIQVFNTNGQLVYQTEQLGAVNKSTITLPLNNLEQGTYYVSVIGALDQKAMVKKLIVLE